MSVAVKKIDGVQSVDVSLNKGLVSIELAVGNHLTMPELRRVITANGFSPKDAAVTVDGTLENRADTPTLRVDGTEEVLVLAPTSSGSVTFDEAKRFAAEHAHVEARGRIDPPNGPERLTVAALKRLGPMR